MCLHYRSNAIRKHLFAVAVFLLTVATLSQPAQAAGLIGRDVVKMLPTDGGATNYFGYSVDVSGDTAVVGAYGDDGSMGAAYVFTRNQGGIDSWGQVAKLTAADRAASDYFGFSVAIDGDTVAVGASIDDDGGLNSGSVYIFSRNQGGADSWGQVTKVVAADAEAYDFFGEAVDLSGDFLVAGASGSDDAGSESGSAYVFTRNLGGADAWGQIAKLTASDAAAGDNFGEAVAISGRTIVAGARLNDDQGSGSGSAYVFSRNQAGADNWGEVKKLIPGGGESGDSFGHSVAIEGDVIVVGTPGDDDGGGAGAAYLFYRNQAGADFWGQRTKLLPADGAASDLFGESVAISGDIITVGAHADDDAGNSSGSAYIFSRNYGGADLWGQAAKVTAADGADGDELGYSVAIGPQGLIAGAPFDDDNGTSSGSAYVFSVRHATDDFDDDGRADILWRSGSSGDVYAWFMNGASVDSGGYVGTVSDTAWQIVATGDLNADGFTDILWRNSSDGTIFAWLLENGAVASIGICGVVADDNWEIVDLRDTGGDGKADILWRHAVSGELYLWTMDGMTVTEAVSLGTVDTGWQIEN